MDFLVQVSGIKEVLTLAAPIESQVVSEIDPIVFHMQNLLKNILVVGKEVIFNVPPLYGKIALGYLPKVLFLLI